MNWQRPENQPAISDGLFLGEQFQIAYASNDIERSKEDFKNQFGIKNFSTLEGATPSGGHIQVALAWVGSTMYELLTATGPGSELYMGKITNQNYQIHLHHLGFIIHNDNQWRKLHNYLERSLTPLLYQNHAKGFMRSCFVSPPNLDHLFEYLYPEPAGLDFFMNKVPKH